jgi:hypothetical protein
MGGGRDRERWGASTTMKVSESEREKFIDNQIDD